jgi:hypothetical protein
METIMSVNVADVLVHIDEILPPDQLKTLENHLYKMGGILKATNQDDKPNLIQVVYDSGKVQARDILFKVESEGLNAELVGL